MQPDLDLFGVSVSDVRSVSPVGEDLPPFQGRSTTTAHASYTGARSLVETWTARQSAYLQLLNTAGALTDHEAAALLGCGLSSVNSIRGNLIDRAEARGQLAPIIEDGFDEHHFTDMNGTPRTTKRARWRIRR